MDFDIKEPYRLVFVKTECDFCKSKENIISLRPSYDIYYGFMTCDKKKCLDSAKMSLYTDFHKRGIVDYKDIEDNRENEDFSKLMDFIELLKDGNYPVSRTGGNVEYDWEFYKGSSIERKKSGEWMIPSHKGELIKKSSIEFMIDTFKTNLSSLKEDEKSRAIEFIDKAEKALEVLQAGVYWRAFIKYFLVKELRTPFFTS